MSIAKPFTFVANTYAKSSEVNANFDTVYGQVNSNISAISQNAVDIENLENNKADINGNTAQRFAVADAITDSDAINKRTLRASIANSIDYISGFVITKDSGSPNNTIIVSEGSCYDSTKTIVLNKTNSSTKTNDNQAANATYYIYVIGNSTGSNVDILISESGVTPGLPSGYSLYRQIGYYTTDSSNNIADIFSYNGEFKPYTYIVNNSYPELAGYRVYPDGWCEQWGHKWIQGNNNSYRLTLLKPYTRKGCIIVGSGDVNYSDGGGIDYNVGGGYWTDSSSASATTITLKASASGDCYWFTTGYIN